MNTVLVAASPTSDRKHLSNYFSSIRLFVAAVAFFAMAGVANVASAAEMVNLNKADAAAIQQSLIGIGPIKAEAIVAYRKKAGKFKSVDDLLNVKGIGPGLIKKNKRYLSLSKGAVSGDSKKYAADKKQAKAKQSGSSSSSKSSSKKSKSKSSDSKSAKKSDSKKTDKASKSNAKKADSSSKKKSTSKTTSKKKKSAKCNPKKDKNCKPTKSKKKSKSKKSKKKKASTT